MTRPVVSVEFDADPDTAGEFVLDSSALGSAAVLATAQRWVAVPSAELLAVSVRRGRRNEWSAYDTGEATITLDDTGQHYDPDSGVGRYQINGVRLLRQRTAVRVLVDGLTVFTGRVAAFALSPDRVRPTVTITAEDALADLGRSRTFNSAMWASGLPESVTSAQAAAVVLDACGVSGSQRSVPAGGQDVFFPTAESSARRLLELLAASNAGRLWCSVDNVVTLKWHDYEYTLTSPVFTFSPSPSSSFPYRSLQVSPGVDAVANYARVRREGGRPEFTAGDAESIDLYGFRDVSADVLLADDADAASLAEYMAARRSGPSRRCSISLDLAQLADLPRAYVLVSDLTAPLLVDTDRGTLESVLESIEYDFTGDRFTARFGFCPPDTAEVYGGTEWFRLDTHALGSTAVLAPL